MFHELKRSQEEGFKELYKRIGDKRIKISITTYSSAGAQLILTTSIVVPNDLLNILPSSASNAITDILQLESSWNACTKEGDVQVTSVSPQGLSLTELKRNPLI